MKLEQAIQNISVALKEVALKHDQWLILVKSMEMVNKALEQALLEEKKIEKDKSSPV